MFYCWSIVLFVIGLSIGNGIYLLLSHRCSVYAFNDKNGCGEAEWSQRHLQLNKMIGHSCMKRTFSSLPLSLSFKMYIFIYLRERVSPGRDRERERNFSRLPTELEAQYRAHLKTLRSMTWAETKNQLLNQLCHPGTPHFPLLCGRKDNLSFLPCLNEIARLVCTISSLDL